MNKVNEKSKTSGKWRTEEERRNSPNRHGHTGTGFNGHVNGCQSLPLDRDDRQTGNTDKRGGYAIIGGILSQLIAKTQSRISDAENNLYDLRSQLRELEELSSQLEIEE